MRLPEEYEEHSEPVPVDGVAAEASVEEAAAAAETPVAAEDQPPVIPRRVATLR
jgi:hypothetical protein